MATQFSPMAKQILNIMKDDLVNYDIPPTISIYIKNHYDLMALLMPHLLKHEAEYLAGVDRVIKDGNAAQIIKTSFQKGFAAISQHLKTLQTMRDEEQQHNHHVSIWLAFIITSVTALHHMHLTEQDQIKNCVLDAQSLEKMELKTCTIASYFVVSSLFEKQLKAFHKELKNPNVTDVMNALIELHKVTMEL